MKSKYLQETREECLNIYNYKNKVEKKTYAIADLMYLETYLFEDKPEDTLNKAVDYIKLHSDEKYLKNELFTAQQYVVWSLLTINNNDSIKSDTMAYVLISDTNPMIRTAGYYFKARKNKNEMSTYTTLLRLAFSQNNDQLSYMARIELADLCNTLGEIEEENNIIKELIDNYHNNINCGFKAGSCIHLYLRLSKNYLELLDKNNCRKYLDKANYEMKLVAQDQNYYNTNQDRIINITNLLDK